ncbi:MAG: HD domain-containing protein [Thermodesulfobacteriota bacterium]
MELVHRWIESADLGNGLLWLVIFLFSVATAVLVFGKRKSPPLVREMTLRELSGIWTKKETGTKTIHISELSSLWRDEKLIAALDLRLPELKNQRAASFMERYVRQESWFQKAALQKAVCGQILQMLDQEGNCPSVVSMNGDVEGSWDENTYQLLARTTLLDHSLNVAEQVVRLLGENESWHVIPDTMIAALGHDLGKLQSLRGHLYSTGEHPLAAGLPLSRLAGFQGLPRKDEILRAINLHHKRPDGLLGKTLKKADQLARQKELEKIAELVATPESNKDNVEESTPHNGKANEEKIAPEPARQDTPQRAAAAWQAQIDIYGDSEKADKADDVSDIPELMDISAWFDAEQFLGELKPYINKMFGRRFLAFSMPDGHVYFQTKVLEEVARKQSERAGCMEIATMAQKDPTMRQVLLTIVQQLRSENDIIARGLIKDNFFGGYFTVTKKIGKSMKGYYTPFHAEAFGSIAEMEQNKSDTLRNIQSVKPYLNDEVGA